MLSIEEFYGVFADSGLLDNARIRLMPDGAFVFVDGTFRSKPKDDFTMPVEDAVPSFKCPASLIPDVDQGCEVLVRGVNYVVRGVEAPDDRGEVLLKLKLAPP